MTIWVKIRRTCWMWIESIQTILYWTCSIAFHSPATFVTSLFCFIAFVAAIKNVRHTKRHLSVARTTQKKNIETSFYAQQPANHTPVEIYSIENNLQNRPTVGSSRKSKMSKRIAQFRKRLLEREKSRWILKMHCMFSFEFIQLIWLLLEEREKLITLSEW